MKLLRELLIIIWTQFFTRNWNVCENKNRWRLHCKNIFCVNEGTLPDYMIVKSTIFCWYYILSPFSFQVVIFLNLVIQLKVSAHVIFLFVRTVLFKLTCYILKIHSPEHIKNITSAFPTPDTDFSFDIAVLILYPSFR